MAIRIVTDSTSDIPINRQAELGIEIVSLTVHFGSEEYIDGVSLTNAQFYEKLATCQELPTTAQVNPEKFEQVFRSYGEEDEIIGIFISSGLSGTFQSAKIAKDLIQSDRIHVIDSKSATFGLALLVFEAIRMRDEGKTAKEICDTVESLVHRLKFFIALDTLKYLKMGGRLSSSSALLGTMLRIKPIITLKDGVVDVADKKPGSKAAVEAVAQVVKADKPDPKYPVVFGDSAAPDRTLMLKGFLGNDIDLANSKSVEMGAVIGTHAGPGCTGMAYIV